MSSVQDHPAVALAREDALSQDFDGGFELSKGCGSDCRQAFTNKRVTDALVRSRDGRFLGFTRMLVF